MTTSAPITTEIQSSSINNMTTEIRDDKKLTEVIVEDSEVEKTTLFVGDLDLTVTDEDLKRLFGEKGELTSVKLCTDSTQQFLGYAYVNYVNPDDAKRALDELNFTYMNGKPIRISFSYKDPSYRKIGANIFVKNLDQSIDNKEFFEIFKSYGNIVSSKVPINSSTGESKGFGYVQFETEESARQAIEKLNGVTLHEKVVYVGPFVSRNERKHDNTKFTNVFVKNFSKQTSEENLRNIFSQYGSVKSLVVMRYEDGTSKCFGFVDFENAQDAGMAIEKLNGHMLHGKQLYVGRAQKKSEREKELNNVHERIEKDDLSGFNNIYVKNLDYVIDDEKFKEMFALFGNITSCKIMRDAKGLSKGVGFVAFTTIQEASNAILQMNGKMFGRKPLYVAIAEKKEARQARFQAIFSNKLPHNIMPISSPQMPIYPSHSPRLPRQIYRGLPPPVFIPPPPVYWVYRGQHQFPIMQLQPPRVHQQINNFRIPLGQGMPKGTVGMRNDTGSMLAGALADTSPAN